MKPEEESVSADADAGAGAEEDEERDEEVNPGDPGFVQPAKKKPSDPVEDDRIPHEHDPKTRGV